MLLAGGPLGTLPARRVPLRAGTRRGLLLALGRLCWATAACGSEPHPWVVVVALGDALLVVDALDRGGGALPVRPLPCLLRDRAKRPLRVADAVGAAR